MRTHALVVTLALLSGAWPAVAGEGGRLEGASEEVPREHACRPQDEARPQQAAPQRPRGRLSGLVFGDFFWMARSHDPAIEDQNGFWIRRIYFTYEYAFSDRLDSRFRLELNSPGDFRGRGRIEPFVKDAYLRWRRGRQAVYLGLSATPTWEVMEQVWGYRALEKTPLDLHRFGNSRDLGVALQGRLAAGGRIRYHLMLGNGTGTRAEVDRGKAVYGSLGVDLTPRFYLEFYADWNQLPGRADRATWQVFAAYRAPRTRIGVHFAQQSRQRPRGVDADRLEIASAFVVHRLRERAWAVVRVDRLFDPNPEGAVIPYLPFDPTAGAWFALLGVDLTPHADVHLIPNVELVRYDETAAGRPAGDVVPRFTFYYVWR